MHSKKVLAEFIYKLNQVGRFFLKAPMWSDPVVGFSYDDSLPSKFMSALDDKNLIDEGLDSVICVLGDWENVAEGIIFTDRALYLNSPKNKDKSCKKFMVRYDDITDLKYDSHPELPDVTIYTSWDIYVINTDLWSKRSIHDFLQFATERYKFFSRNKDSIESIFLDSADYNSVGMLASGVKYGRASATAKPKEKTDMSGLDDLIADIEAKR